MFGGMELDMTKTPTHNAMPLGCLAFLPRMVRAAQDNGYALTVHGSLTRDFDFVAIPWTEKACAPADLAAAMIDACGGFLAPHEEHEFPRKRPHGRLCWAIHLGAGPYIDLSVMPPNASLSSGREVARLLEATVRQDPTMEQKNLMIDSILQAVEKCRGMVPPDPFDLLMPRRRLFGMDIIEAPVRVVQKIKLSDGCPVSDEFRADFNAWLVQMFGTRDVSPVQPGMAYMFGNNILMRPESIARLTNCIS